MRRVADAGDRGSDHQVIEDEAAETAQHLFVDLQVRGRLFQVDEREEGARHAENCAGGARSRRHRLPIHAGDAAKDAAREIRQKIREAAHKNFRGPSQTPQAPHVEPDMDNPKMHKHAGGQTPPLAVERERPEVRAERNGLLRGRKKEGDPSEHHHGEHERVDADKSDSHRKEWQFACPLRDWGGFFLYRFPLRQIAGGALVREIRIAGAMLEFLPAEDTTPGRHGTEMVAGFAKARICCTQRKERHGEERLLSVSIVWRKAKAEFPRPEPKEEGPPVREKTVMQALREWVQGAAWEERVGRGLLCP